MKSIEKTQQKNYWGYGICEISVVSRHATVYTPEKSKTEKFIFAVTPLDVVKIRLQQQTRPFPKGECFYYHNGLMEHVCVSCEVRKPCEWYQRPGNFRGTADAIVKIARHEGIRSLWSGLSPTMVMALPATVFYFTTYDNLSVWLKKKLEFFCC